MANRLALLCSSICHAAGHVLSLTPTAPVQQAQPGALTKFHDLVVKCLIKLTKGLQASQEVQGGLTGAGTLQ